MTQHALQERQTKEPHQHRRHKEQRAKDQRHRARCPEIKQVAEDHRPARQRQRGNANAAHRIGIKGMQLDARQAQQMKRHQPAAHQQRKQQPRRLHHRKGRRRAKAQSKRAVKRDRDQQRINQKPHDDLGLARHISEQSFHRGVHSIKGRYERAV